MSTTFSAFYKSIQRKLGDESTSTKVLIQDFTGDRLDDFLSRYRPKEMLDTVNLATTSGTRAYETSALGSYDTNNIHSIKEPTQGVTLKKMALKRYEELVASATSVTGDPTHFVPVTDTTFYLYPTPNSATNLTAYLYSSHPVMTADGMYFWLTDKSVKLIKYGVLADLYEDRDDTRAAYYDRKYEKGLKQAIANERRDINDNQRLLPGNSIE